ncbi:hypothetical protein FE88_32390 [Azospirillum brasilense]|nr:hypothetical protein AMK58_25470 [Azospirillum brasilense]OPH14779.1 hypothetical protein FE89_14515 [Azospirillum brasilense]OPH17393.1 hypothetical protein FE88_32390 [Azospirillum brasilense]PWC85006.1 hypothetical protein AEJ54_28990 [Azospirillum sp. Sp 7]
MALTVVFLLSRTKIPFSYIGMRTSILFLFRVLTMSLEVMVSAAAILGNKAKMMQNKNLFMIHRSFLKSHGGATPDPGT